MFVAKRIVLIITVCGALISIYYSVLLARADLLRRDNTPESLKNAVRLVPGNAEYHALLAEHLEAEGLNPDAELELATRLSPGESRFWIRRGFRAELEQKYAESERFLLEARRADNGFDPRSALMNYYFRRGKFPEFWKSAHDALEMSYGDSSAIFRLCLAANEDPAVTRAILPPGRSLIHFMSYLVRSGRLELAERIAAEAVTQATNEDIPLFLDYCERQERGSSGLAVWNAMCDRHLLPFSSLSPGEGRILTNGDFSDSLHRGYDWKFGNAEGVSINSAYTGGESITLSGKQPDRVVLLEQRMPVTAGKAYFIEYEYQLDGASGDSGLRWTVERDAGDNLPRQEPSATSSTLAGETWHTDRLPFVASQASVKLRLEYQRALGTIRWQGTVQLRRVKAGGMAEK